MGASGVASAVGSAFERRGEFAPCNVFERGRDALDRRRQGQAVGETGARHLGSLYVMRGQRKKRRAATPDARIGDQLAERRGRLHARVVGANDDEVRRVRRHLIEAGFIGSAVAHAITLALQDHPIQLAERPMGDRKEGSRHRTALLGPAYCAPERPIRPFARMVASVHASATERSCRPSVMASWALSTLRSTAKPANSNARRARRSTAMLETDRASSTSEAGTMP